MRWTENPARRSREDELAGLTERWLSADDIARATRTVRRWPGYLGVSPTPLPGFARRLGVAALHYQDEGARFDILSFKPWGGAYATARLLERVPTATVACATDGNHGRAVAWAAERSGARAVVYMADVASAHAESEVRALGAEVVRCRGNHEVASAACLAAAREHGWYVITETENATEPQIATDTLAGYGALWEETLDGLRKPPTHMFIQAGVGGLAAVAAAATARRFGEARPVLTVVEAQNADCIRRSLEAGRRVSIGGHFDTRLAGLAAGATSESAWAILRVGADFAMTIEDGAAEETMRRLANPERGDPAIVAGGSGASGLAAALTACADPAVREATEMGPDARILTIGTEGATDPESYARIVDRPASTVLRHA